MARYVVNVSKLLAATSLPDRSRELSWNGRGIISIQADGRFVFAFRMRKMDGCSLGGWSRSRVRVRRG